MHSGFGKQPLNAGKLRASPLVWLSVSCAVFCAGILFFAFDPERFQFFPRCVFHQLTSLNCPGCGGQRALHRLLHGDLASAVHYNALLVGLLPLGVWLLACQVMRRVFHREPPALFSHHAWAWLLASIVLVFAILRNLPFAAFAWMSP